MSADGELIDEELELELLATQPSGAAVGRVVAGSPTLVGKLVLACARHACGRCEVCRRGGAAVCPSSRATGTRISSRWAVVLDGFDLPLPAAAAVAGDFATAYTLYARTGLAPRDPVVVTG